MIVISVQGQQSPKRGDAGNGEKGSKADLLAADLSLVDFHDDLSMS